MIYASIAELSDEGVNRYMLSIATAKSARRITDEQLEKAQLSPEVREDKYQSYSVKKQTPDDKPVKEAIEKLYTREYKIIVNENK
jgi:hypothetical protein